MFRTEDFELAPGQERYLCYAVTTQERLAVKQFSSSKHPTVHHLLFSEASSPEPEGTSECAVLFKATWMPMFFATTAATEIAMPDGAAKLLEPGSQMVVQLHLVNTTDKRVTDFSEIRMVRSNDANPEPVRVFAFGTTNIHLPPQQTTTLAGNCTVKNDVRLFAFMPHMHLLGKRLELLTGADENNLQSVFVRDPYDFNNQYIEPLPLNIPAGSAVQTRCTYDNPGDKEVTFGESSYDEMCFVAGLQVGGSGLSSCIESPPAGDGGVVPRAPDAGVCGEVETPTGVGRHCTMNGSECPAGMTCTAGQAGTDPNAGGYCIKIGCEAQSDCGTGGTCCTPTQAGGLVNICIPEACRPLDCRPVP